MYVRLREWVSALFCSHLDICSFEDERMYLTCLQCGRKTPGWEIPSAFKTKNFTESS